jgi:3-oxoadipate enol-lactonase
VTGGPSRTHGRPGALLRALEVPAAYVVSQSGGSVIAQELALRHPELVRSPVLIGAWARPDL